MSEVSIIGLDIAKNVFHAHGADASGRALFSRKIGRGKLLEFFAGHQRCTVALEASGGAHHWGRELTRLGYEVKLIPPAYVKLICPLLSGPKLMIFWITKETWNAEQEASPGRDYRQAA